MTARRNPSEVTGPSRDSEYDPTPTRTSLPRCANPERTVLAATARNPHTKENKPRYWPSPEHGEAHVGGCGQDPKEEDVHPQELRGLLVEVLDRPDRRLQVAA